MDFTGRRLGRFGAALLLVGFLAHAGDGLMAAMCAPDAAHDPAAHAMSAHDTSTHETIAMQAGHDDPSSHDADCPFGDDALAVCGAGATAPSPILMPAVSPLTASGSILPAPDTGVTALFATKLYRPPRA